MMLKKMTMLGAVVCLLAARPAMGQLLIDDFDYTNALSGFTLLLDDTEIQETSLETGLPDAFWFGYGAMGKGTGIPDDDFSGARYLQMDWQGHQSPFIGHLGRVKVNKLGSGVADVKLLGDPRVIFGYGRALGPDYAFGPLDFRPFDVFKLELAAPEAKDLTFGLFLYGQVAGQTQLWSSAPFQLAAGDTIAGYDVPEDQTFMAWDGSGFVEKKVNKILKNLTGIALVIRGDQNPDVRFEIDMMYMDLFGSLAGDLNANGVVDGDDVLAVSAAVNLGDPVGDVNEDGVADAADLEYVVTKKLLMDEETGAVGTAMGDLNLDGLVNAVDLAMMGAYFATSGGWGQGNLNDDGLVNATDLAMLAQNFGFIAPALAVPEPVSLSLLSIGAVALLRRKRN